MTDKTAWTTGLGRSIKPYLEERGVSDNVRTGDGCGEYIGFALVVACLVGGKLTLLTYLDGTGPFGAGGGQPVGQAIRALRVSRSPFQRRDGWAPRLLA